MSEIKAVAKVQQTATKRKRLPLKEVSADDKKIINETPFLLSLLYDLDLLPEQFAVLKSNPGYPLMFERFIGVMCCYRAMKELGMVKEPTNDGQ